MDSRHYQNREIQWCRYSDHGLDFMRPSKPYRIGRLLRRRAASGWPSNKPPHAVVHWNGLKGPTTYHSDFIAVFAVSKDEVLPDIPHLPVIEHLLRSKAWHS